MRMRAGLFGLVAGILVTTGSPTSGAPPGPVPQAGSSSSHVVVREYGDGPVRVPSGLERVRVLFHGRAGDKVRLDSGDLCPIRLRRLDGRRVLVTPSTFWRLPTRGRYAFVYRRCATAYEPTLQLEKLVPHRLVIDGAPTRWPRRRGYVDAGALRVPRSGRIQLYAVATWSELMLPDGGHYQVDDAYDDPDGRLFVEAGRRLAGAYGALPTSPGTRLRMRSGDRLLLVPRTQGPERDGTVTVHATSAVLAAATLDGDALTVSNGGVPFREVQVEFDGSAGEWVHLERVGAPTTPFADPVLVDPTGHQLLNPTLVYHPYWQLPLSGHYRVMLATGEAPFSGTVRVRRMRLLPQVMPTDGSPLTFAASTPGEWMLASFSLPESDLHAIHVESFTAEGDWSAFVDREERYLCVGSPFDCGTGTYAVATAEHLVSATFNYWVPAGSWVVVVRMATGQTGSVTLSLPPTTAFPRPQPSARTPISRGTALPRL